MRNNHDIAKYGFLVTVFSILLIFVNVVLLLLDDSGKYNPVLAVSLLVFNLLSLFRARKNMLFAFIMFAITYYNYSICAANYLWLIRSTMFTGYAQTEIGYSGLRILLLFSIILYFVTSSVAKKMPKRSLNVNVISNNPENLIIVFLLSIVLVLIWIYGFGRPTSVGQRGSPSTYFEYSVILIIIAYYYSGQNVTWKIIISVIGIAYAGLNLLYGGRATGLQVILCMLFCTVIDRIPKRWLVIGGFLLFIIMSLIGVFRAAAAISIDSLNYVWERLRRTKFATDTAYSSYFTSMTFIDYSTECSWSERLYYFGRWLLYIPLGGIISDSNLPVVTRRFYIHYGGGVLPYYFHFFMGGMGIVLIGVYLYWLFLHSYSEGQEKKGFWRCIATYVSVTSLRWYVYSPSQITRGVLLFAIAYWVILLLDKIMRGVITKKTQNITF